MPGLRKRIDAFFDQGLERVLDGVFEDKPTMIHGDLGKPLILLLLTKRSGSHHDKLLKA